MAQRFEYLIIIGRPGSGKSEIVDLIRKTSLPQRMLYYHIGDFVELDDFVWLNAKLKEDDDWEEIGEKRKFSKRVNDGRVVTDASLWDFCIETLNYEATARRDAASGQGEESAVLIEFSRGGNKTYEHSLSLLSDEILSRSAILHLDITYEEALVRNELRYKKGKEDTELHHKVPLEEMEASYKKSDWPTLSDGDPRGFIDIRKNRVPFISVRNHPIPNDEKRWKELAASSLHSLFMLKYGAAAENQFTVKSSEGGEAIKFDNLIIIGRPASGKSEFIKFIKSLPAQNRYNLFYLGELEEVDDYMFLSEKFREDGIWTKVLGKTRYAQPDDGGYFMKVPSLYTFVLHQVNKLIVSRYLPNPNFYDTKTLLVEFSRGGAHTYEDSFKLLDPEILKRSAIFYVKTSYDECIRRNIARFEEKKRLSIMAHKVSPKEMEKTYRTDDWENVTGGKESGFVTLNGVRMPFASMDNENESKDPDVLTKRYKRSLDMLFTAYRASRK